MTTPFPLNHSTQIPDNALLDISGKQTYLGNSFILGTGTISLSDTNEHLELALVNTSTSGKALFINGRRLSSSAGVYMKMYIGPTGVSGTPAIPLNLRPAYSTSSVVTAYSSPSASANGTLVSTILSVGAVAESNLLYVLDPGETALFTVTALSS